MQRTKAARAPAPHGFRGSRFERYVGQSLMHLLMALEVDEQRHDP